MYIPTDTLPETWIMASVTRIDVDVTRIVPGAHSLLRLHRPRT